jgi:hypothetical protein
MNFSFDYIPVLERTFSTQRSRSTDVENTYFIPINDFKKHT